LAVCLAAFGPGSTKRAADVLIGAATFMTLGGVVTLSAGSRGRSFSAYGYANLIWRTFACLAGAFALNLLYWVIVVEPHAPPGERYVDALTVITSIVDVPVAVVGVIMPLRVRDHAVDVYMQSFGYGYTRFCFGIPPGMLWNHLAVAVPVWFAILFMPTVVGLVSARRAG